MRKLPKIIGAAALITAGFSGCAASSARFARNPASSPLSRETPSNPLNTNPETKPRATKVINCALNAPK